MGGGGGFKCPPQVVARFRQTLATELCVAGDAAQQSASEPATKQRGMACALLILNYDRPATTQHQPMVWSYHGWAFVDGPPPLGAPWEVKKVKATEFNFMCGDSSLSVLKQVGEDPLTTDARGHWDFAQGGGCPSKLNYTLYF